MTCFAISWIFISRGLIRSLVALSVTFYVVGLMGKAYATTALGFHTSLNFRNGPYFGLIFFVTGYLLQRQKPKPSWFLWGIAIWGFGVILHFCELFALHHYWGASMNQDYLVGTYFAGVGAGLVALSDAPFLRSTRLSLAGPLVLGVYAVQIVFVELLSPLRKALSGMAIWEIGFPFLVLALSILSAYGMSRVRVLRPIVT
jgi:hypothetical protein